MYITMTIYYYLLWLISGGCHASLLYELNSNYYYYYYDYYYYYYDYYYSYDYYDY